MFAVDCSTIHMQLGRLLYASTANVYWTDYFVLSRICHFQTVDACCEICLHDLSTERLEELLDFCSILLSNKFGKLYQFNIVQALNTFMP